MLNLNSMIYQYIYEKQLWAETPELSVYNTSIFHDLYFWHISILKSYILAIVLLVGWYIFPKILNLLYYEYLTTIIIYTYVYTKCNYIKFNNIFM